ncbi:hypothetical protein [Rossellomorea aquimaris]|nr:hypothetical protein [Rossellomorea aquimaris]
MNFVKIFLGQKGNESKNCCSIEIKEVETDRKEENCCHIENNSCC